MAEVLTPGSRRRRVWELQLLGSWGGGDWGSNSWVLGKEEAGGLESWVLGEEGLGVSSFGVRVSPGPASATLTLPCHRELA